MKMKCSVEVQNKCVNKQTLYGCGKTSYECFLTRTNWMVQLLSFCEWVHSCCFWRLLIWLWNICKQPYSWKKSVHFYSKKNKTANSLLLVLMKFPMSNIFKLKTFQSIWNVLFGWRWLRFYRVSPFRSSSSYFLPFSLTI